MKVYVHLWRYLTQYSLDWESFRTNIVEKIKTHIFCLITFVYKSCLFEIVLNTIQPEGPHMTI